ncbi:IS5 family transposase [Kitasatospora indigofera]|uniref:IS5 family transposase n=1 Tax=Kitasatospora indigofera TaxID=67307 RepID=UPI00369BDAC7
MSSQLSVPEALVPYCVVTVRPVSNSGVSPCDCLAHLFGNAADQPDRPRRYPSDLTDAEWALIRPLLPVPAWMNGRGGRPEGFCQRQMIDAVRYLVAEGVRWASLPADYPRWRAVYRFFRRWRDNDLIRELYGRLRARLHELAGKREEPTAAIIDSQSVKGDATVPAASRGYDAEKKINGRKRHIAVDTLGLLLVVMVTAASVSDRDAGRDLLQRQWAVVRASLPVPGWLEGRGGQPEGYCHRQMFDAVRYLVAGGISWRAMPVDFPAWDRVDAFYRRWRDQGLIKELHDRLRGRVREAAGRDPEPTAGIIDSQSVRAAASVPRSTPGYDGGKKVPGRKRHIGWTASGCC